jgi:hypothetical protein
MGNTPNLLLPYPEPSNPADVPTDMHELASRLDLLGGALVSSLPAGPVEGQEVYYVADAAAGAIWHLRYRAASPSAYKWEVVGGSSLKAVVMTDEALAPINVFSDLPTVGPQITLPLAGDYAFEYQANYYAGAAAVQVAIVPIGGTQPTDNLADTLSSANPMSGRYGGLLAAQPAGRVCKLQYSTSVTGIHFRWRKLDLTPVRVG